ncbi:MAG TPA: precorrin-3B synthase [Xanthobacteraceae bacterium]
MNAPLRRGACPGLSAPMQTGDGLLVRMLPIGTIALAAFAALCAAAREHGNGVVEITARGSIQVRGLSPTSAPRFAAAIAAFGIAASEGIAVHATPLSGLDLDEILDAEEVAADLRRALAERALAAQLAPKISVAIDGGGKLGLDGLAADVRLRAKLKNGQAAFAVGVGGDRASETHLGFIAAGDAAAAVIRLLEIIGERGRNVRVRDLVASEGAAQFKAVFGDLLLSSNKLSCPALCRASTSNDGANDVDGRDKPGHDQALGVHRLRDGSLAYGLGLAFGHADASSLDQLAKTAATAGARGLRTAPARVVLAIGIAPDTLQGFAVEAERLGFIVRANDPRRFVVACAGAPICASAHIAARTIAPRIATDCAQALAEGSVIHVSGCAKGCAHPTSAPLTVVGTAKGCGLVADGTARDAPFAMVTVDEMPAALARHARSSIGGAHHV